MELLYSAVYDLQGVQLNQWLVRKLIQHSEMSSADNITHNLLTEHPVTVEQAGRLWDDPYYGFGSRNVNEGAFVNYWHWEKLLNTTDPYKMQEKVAFEWELRTYFGLSFDQVDEIATKWSNF